MSVVVRVAAPAAGLSAALLLPGNRAGNGAVLVVAWCGSHSPHAARPEGCGRRPSRGCRWGRPGSAPCAIPRGSSPCAGRHRPHWLRRRSCARRPGAPTPVAVSLRPGQRCRPWPGSHCQRAASVAAPTRGIGRRAHAVILWLSGLFGLVLIAGALTKSPWLPRAVVAYTAGALLVFGLAAPERIVAERNVARFEDTGRFDWGYASTLGADALPALARLPAELRGCAIGSAFAYFGGDNWAEWNRARARARDVLDDLQLPPVMCAIP